VNRTLPVFLRVVPLGVALLLTGCWTSKEQGAALRKDVDALKNRLSNDIAESRKERDKLQKVMEQATALLTRNSADVGAQVDRLQSKIDKLSGQLEEAEKKANDVNQQLAEFKAKVEVKLDSLSSGAPQHQPPVPQDKEQLYSLAQSRLSAGDHQEARRLLRHFATTYPTDPRADRAELLLGNSYFAENDFAKAIVVYRKIFLKGRKSPVYPDVLYQIGMAYYQMKDCRNAQAFLSELLKRYRRYPKAAQVRKILKLIKRYRKNRQFCTP
jgi:TolA-binding protein